MRCLTWSGMITEPWQHLYSAVQEESWYFQLFCGIRDGQLVLDSILSEICFDLCRKVFAAVVRRTSFSLKPELVERARTLTFMTWAPGRASAYLWYFLKHAKESDLRSIVNAMKYLDPPTDCTSRGPLTSEWRRTGFALLGNWSSVAFAEYAANTGQGLIFGSLPEYSRYSTSFRHRFNACRVHVTQSLVPKPKISDESRTWALVCRSVVLAQVSGHGCGRCKGIVFLY